MCLPFIRPSRKGSSRSVSQLIMSTNNMKVSPSHSHEASWMSLKDMSIRFLVSVIHSTQDVSCLPLGIVNTNVPNGIMSAIQMPRLSPPSSLANVYFKARELAAGAHERHRKSLQLVRLMITLPH